jgi:hypothetical protein
VGWCTTSSGGGEPPSNLTFRGSSHDGDAEPDRVVVVATRSCGQAFVFEWAVANESNRFRHLKLPALLEVRRET